MSRRFNTKRALRNTTAKTLKVGLLLSALTAALGSGLGQAARAAGFVYQQHTVNAGVLVTTSDPSPYIFYVLNNRPDVRLPDMTFINPLAPTGLSSASAAYWEVPLNSVSDSELAQYNVLYMRADGIQFGPIVNEKLRRFVDNGGQLIVEYATAVPTPTPTTPPVASWLFTGTGATGAPTALPLTGAVVSRHPIISQPYFLSPQEIVSLTIQPTTLTNSVGYINANASDLVHAGEYNNVFTPVLVDGTGAGTGPVISAAQIGAGQVIVTTLSLGVGISVDATYRIPTGTGPFTFNPANLYLASTADLKVLTNIVSWAESHPSENKNSHGSASNTGLSSFSPAWQFPSGSTGTPAAPPAPAVWGNFVFAVDSTGVLSAFDAYPSENLTGAANAAGAETTTSNYPTTSYDQIWKQSVGTGASAPTVAAFGGVNYVFVEKYDGTVVAYNAVTGVAGPTLTAPAALASYPAVPYPIGSVVNAPAPTYYDGRLYAAQANGTLHVYDLNEGTSSAVPLDPTVQTAPAEYATGSPSVGLIASGDSNVMAAVVPTNYNMYTVLLGARNEPLIQYTLNGALNGYSIARSRRYDLTNLFADLYAVPALVAYDYNGNVQSGTANSTAPNPQDPLFALTSTIGYYTDWNMDFPNSTFNGGGTAPPNQVNLNFVAAASFGALNTAGATSLAATALSAPAIDRHGDYYYTETLGANSYVVGVANDPLYTNVRLKFRFLMPRNNVTDADGTDYSQLTTLHFVGAPVVDNQANVYVAAINDTGTSATVLCFRGGQTVSAVLQNAPAGTDLTQYTFTQGDENGGADNTIQRGPDTNIGTSAATYGQFIPSATSLSFYNFGKRSQTPKQIAGNLTEPQPITATAADGSGGTQTLFMRTNLAWYVKPFTTTRAVAGLTQVGNSLLLSDGTYLYRVSTKPRVNADKSVNPLPSVTPFVTPIGADLIGAGAVAAPPSVGGNVLAVNGVGGLAARTRQVTVIADSRRVLGVDGDGSAVWAVDATTQANPASNFATKVPFSHPTSLSQFAVNDYLAADTGSNRCVRFDSAGNVRWELTRFTDPTGLLGTGQPLTLSQPSSVVTRTIDDPDTTNNPNGKIVYYLVSDSGNDRLVEVADEVDSSGNLVLNSNGVPKINHVLTWASHTGDRDGRRYRYASAAYYRNITSASGISIAAIVSNTRLAPLTTAGLGPISGDAAGGSIVVFNYPVNPQPFSAAAPSDLVYTTAGFYAQAAANGPYTPFTIRNPRFLQLYTSPTATAPAVTNGAAVPAFDFLYADDNGAFDLTYVAGQKAFVATPDRLQFKARDYQTMTQPAFGVAGTPSRTGLPFVPTCVQGLGTDGQSGSGNTTRRYLLTQNYSQGELSTLNTNGSGKLGGEIFEVDMNTGATPIASKPGGFAGGATLSHPDLTGPLTQPTFGVRLP